jgi:hypothetical protein
MCTGRCVFHGRHIKTKCLLIVRITITFVTSTYNDLLAPSVILLLPLFTRCIDTTLYDRTVIFAMVLFPSRWCPRCSRPKRWTRLHSASSLKQLSTGRHVAALGNIIPISKLLVMISLWNASFFFNDYLNLGATSPCLISICIRYIMWKSIGDIMFSVLASSVVDRGLEPLSGQTKDYKIGIFCF